MFKANGSVLVFGWNVYGQLGLGDTIDRLSPTLNPYLNPNEIIQWSLSSHTLVLLSNVSNYFLQI